MLSLTSVQILAILLLFVVATTSFSNVGLPLSAKPLLSMQALIGGKVDTTTNDHFRSLIHKLDANLDESLSVLVLVGIPGSGKTTYCEELVQLFGDRWVSHNQDVLKTRKNVIHATEKSLQRNKSVIIDRCNFDPLQRATWIDLGGKYRVNNILCVVVPEFCNVELCTKRCFERGDDGIHPDGDTTDWNEVCQRMKKAFVYPAMSEGFTGIYECAVDSSTKPLTALFKAKLKERNPIL